MARRVRIPLLAMATLVSAVVVGGCGLGTGPGTKTVTLTITRAFGSQSVGTAADTHLGAGETVIGMLERHFKAVQTRTGGASVESINGLSGGSDDLNWSYYVNGVLAPKGPTVTALNAGDSVWWDLHDSSATSIIPAVVGSFPEPFKHGIGGERLPTTLECASGMNGACAIIEKQLDGDGVPVAPQYIGTGSGPDTLGIVVGTWTELRAEVAAGLIDNGPSASGVYARFAAGGRSLELLNPLGTVARTMGAGAGLVAATADSQSAPTWMITGTDRAGVLAAARAVTAVTLHDHFAVAVQGSTDIPVPVEPRQ
jgi:Domain of unknown function (DUF4430)